MTAVPFVYGAGLRRGLAPDGGLAFYTPGPGGVSAAALPDREAEQLGGALANLCASLQFKVDSQGRTRNDAYARGMAMTEQAISNAQSAVRNDSGFSAGLGGGLNPRDLTHRMKRVLEQRMPPMQAKRILPVNTEVRPGAAKYEQYRTYHTGEAVAYRGQSSEAIPGVGIGRASFEAPIVYFVTAVRTNWLEVMQGGFGGLDIQARKMAAGRRVMEEAVDRRAWLGDSSLNLFGVYNHPYMDTIVATSEADSTAADTLVAELISLANRASELSSGAYQPDTMVVSQYLLNDFASRRFGNGSDMTVLEHFKKSCPHITKIETCHRFDNVGGDGVHGIFFCKGKGADGASAELVQPMGTTLLPADTRALNTSLYLVCAFGGVNQNQVGDNLFVLMSGR